jgi:outer membrane protein OmpA-like peptidoglycan-associated protein
MARHRCFSLAFVSSIILACLILLTPLCFAQDNLSTDANVQPADCPALAAFPQLAATVVVSCNRADSIELKMPMKPDAQGFAREKSVRGAYEFREYRIPRIDQQERAFDNLMQLIPMAGFIVKYSSSPSTITARKGDTWILLNVSGDFYNISVVRVKEEPWTPSFKNAEEILREVNTGNRVAIYGIEFSPDNQAINEKGSKSLIEVLKCLKENPNLAVVVESHKFGTTGNAEDDLEITRKRANVVVGWLVEHGVAAGRLQSKALGRTKPVTENDTAVEIRRNERIALARAAL